MNRLDVLKSYFKSLWGNYFYILLFFTASRLFFYFYFLNDPNITVAPGEISSGLLLGFRYDTVVICYFLAPIFLWGVLTTTIHQALGKAFLGLSKVYLWIALLLIDALIITDLAFYSYFQERLNYLLFGFWEDDTVAVLTTLWKDYPVIPGVLLLGFITWINTKVVKRSFNVKTQRVRTLPSFFKRMILPVLLIVFHLATFALGLRGTIKEMPLEPKYTDFSPSQMVNDFSVNGFVTFEKAVRIRFARQQENKTMAEVYQVKDLHALYSNYMGLDVSKTPEKDLPELMWRQVKQEKAIFEGAHVIVVMMESMGSFWLKYQSADFNILGAFKSHYNNDLYFPNMVSSDNGTIGSVLSVLTAIPKIPGLPYLTDGKRAIVKLSSMAHLPFKKAGYETSFIYGGKLSWRRIGSYMRRQGFDAVVGENTIRDKVVKKGQEVYGTEWGVYDEYLFEYVAQKLEKAARPQFIFVLSTSNHPPFEVPSHYVKPRLEIPSDLSQRVTRLPEEMADRFMVYRYSNDKLGEFVSRVKEKEPNSVITVTGDHNFWGYMNYTDEEYYQKYGVPLYFSFPHEVTMNTQQLASHLDIMPTLYHATLTEGRYWSLGRNLFRDLEEVRVFNANFMATKDYVIEKNDVEYIWKNEIGASVSKKEKSPGLVDQWRAMHVLADEFILNQKN